MSDPAFVHLRLHSEYSVVDGIVRLDEAIEAAVADRMPALALTDLSNTFGLVKFYKDARARGVGYGFLFMRPEGGQLAEIGKLVEAGALRPIIDREFEFEDTPAALERSASGRARGKVVIRRTVDA